jgi:hypothetical protein
MCEDCNCGINVSGSNPLITAGMFDETWKRFDIKICDFLIYSG